MKTPVYSDKSIRFQASAEARAFSRDLAKIEARQKSEPEKSRSNVAKLLARIATKK